MHGIVGFLRILDEANDNFVSIHENYIEFDTKNLINFNRYYFEYFFKIYNFKNNAKQIIESNFMRLATSLKKISNEEENELNKNANEKKVKENIKSAEKYIKNYVLDKMKKYNETAYNNAIEYLKEIEEVNSLGKVNVLDEVEDKLLDEIEKVNERVTYSRFSSNLNSKYFGQISFLNISNSNKTYEEKCNKMYDDYISNIIEADFLNDILIDKYENANEIKEIINLKDSNRISNEVLRHYKKINAIIDKTGDVSEVKEYIKHSVLNKTCSMCDNSNEFTEVYSEAHFIPIALSSDNRPNMFWNSYVDFPICDICKLILFCTAAGMNSVTKVIKEYSNGSYKYKTNQMINFINYDSNIKELKKYNEYFRSNSYLERKDSVYAKLILEIVSEMKIISRWLLDNMFIVELDADYMAKFSRIDYFTISRNAATYFKNYSAETLAKIYKYDLKLQVVEYIIKNKELKYILEDRTHSSLIENEIWDKNGYDILLVTKIRLILNMLKEDINMPSEKISEQSKKIHVLYMLGVEIHEKLKAKNEENKMSGFEYQMLNSLKSGNKADFIDIVIRLHMAMNMQVSQIFLDVMKDDGIDFESVGYSFIAGLISDRYQKSVETKDETNSSNE